MLERQGSNSNSYQWWWVRHIRTKQSKWLEEDLQDMEVKVKSMMKLIEEDADSFAKRAELYFKKRPELINFVEEFYRAYRALAEKYDHISGELHSANSTIATVLADRIKLPIDEEINANSLKVSSKAGSSKSSNRSSKSPQIKISKKDEENRKPAKKSTSSSNMNRAEAEEEAKRIQKKRLVLESEKGFIKSLYENGLAKYWEIEKQIIELQEQVCCLQEEFELGSTVEGDEVQALMAAAALKSCGETLARLQEQQPRTEEEAQIESERVRDIEEKLKVLKFEFLQRTNEAPIAGSAIKSLEEDMANMKQEKMELQEICRKIREHLELDSNKLLILPEVAEKIDELVNTVTGLETSVLTQAAKIERLRSETDQLQKQLKGLEEDKSTLINDSKRFNDKIRDLEEELEGVQALNRSVEDKKTLLQNNFSEACRNLDVLAEKLQICEKQEAIENAGSSQGGTVLNVESEQQSTDPEAIFVSECALEFEPERKNVDPNPFFEPETVVNIESVEKNTDPSQIFESDSPMNFESQTRNTDTEESVPNCESQTQIDGDIEDLVLGVESHKQSELTEDLHRLHRLLLERMDDREKLLLAEYTSILRNYKETKRRLSELENQNQETFCETTVQISDLKSSIAMKDLEIQSLRQKLSALQSNSDELSFTKSVEFHDPPDLELDRSESPAEAHRPDPEVISKLPIFESFGDRNPKFTWRPDESNAGTDTEASARQAAEEEIEMVRVDAADSVSKIEDKFRRDIDESLEENLMFWLRFTASFDQIQKFQVTLQDLQAEFLKTKERENIDQAAKAEALPIDKSLRELQGDLEKWLDQNALLKEELQCRLSSLGRIREEISRGSLMAGAAGGLTAYQAGKFEGEVVGMQQENKKVADELQAGLEHVKGLQFEVEKTMQKMNENLEIEETRDKPGLRQTTSKKGIPLRTFIFGVKPKKPSIFSSMNPALHKQFSERLRAGFPM